MREIKVQVLFKIHDSCFNGDIHKHHTTVDRLCNGLDTFDYKNADVIAKRQFTGLTDKNGVEIYEGDIVSSNFYGSNVDWDDIAEISYCSEKAKFVFNNGDGEQDAFIEGVKCGCLKVIGNIHQNSDLLK